MLRLNIYILFLLFINSSAFGNYNIDSLSKAYNNATEDAKLDIILENVSKFYRSNYELAIKWCKEGRKLAKSNNRTYDYIAISQRFASCLYVNKHEEKALSIYVDLLPIAEKHKDLKQLFNIYNNSAILYKKKSDFVKALDFYKKSLGCALKLENDRRIGMTLMNLGNVYAKLSNLEDAYNNYTEALKYEGFKTNDRSRAYLYINLASIIQKDTTNNKDPKPYIEKAEVIFEKLKDTTNLISTNINLGSIHFSQKQYKLALEHYLKGLKLEKKLSDMRLKAVTFVDLGSTYLALKKHKKAKEYALKALAISKEKSLLDLKKNAYLLLFQVSEELQNHKQSIVYLKHYHKLIDSLQLKDAKAKIANLQIQYRTEKHKQEIAHMNLEMKSSQNTLYLIIAVLSLVFTMFMLLLNRYRTNKKIHLALVDKQKMIELKNVALNQKNIEILDKSRELSEAFERLNEGTRKLQASNDTKETLISLIGHDLRNPLHAILLSSETLKYSLSKIDNKQLAAIVNSIFNSTKYMSNLLDNLLIWSNIQMNKIDIHISNNNINDIISNTMFLSKEIAEKKELEINFIRSQFPHAEFDAELIKTVIKLLIDNAIKYTPQGGKISISAKIINENLEIYISDNSVGYDSSDFPDTYDIGSILAKPKKGGEYGSGLNLSICYKLIQMHSGKIWIDNTDNYGNSFKISIPQT